MNILVIPYSTPKKTNFGANVVVCAIAEAVATKLVRPKCVRTHVLLARADVVAIIGARADILATKLGIILLFLSFSSSSFYVLFSQKGFA